MSRLDSNSRRRKSVVELAGPAFRAFAARRAAWRHAEGLRDPGAIQYSGPAAESPNLSLRLLHPPKDGGEAQAQA
eukprot:tig00021037_g17420.t1